MFRRTDMDQVAFKKRLNQHVFTRNREWHELGTDADSDTDADAVVSTGVLNGNSKGYEPTVADLLMLVACANRSSTMKLPVNLLLEIFEFGEYHPLSTVVRDQIVPGGSDQNDLHLSLCIRQPRYFSLNDIVYTVDSKDQGWSSCPAGQKGTRFGSHTWAEAALSSDPSRRYEVCVNIHAGSAYERQSKTFGRDTELFGAVSRELAKEAKDPLQLQLWIRSLYPGWANHVRYAEIGVKWKFSRWEEYINGLER